MPGGERRLLDSVDNFCRCTNEGQEPGRAEVARDGRILQVFPNIGALVASHVVRHSLAHVRGHLHAVSAVAERVEESVMLARMNHLWAVGAHLFINKQSAVRTTQVSNVWINSTLGMSAQALREDRILDEAHATRDIRRLCDLFGLSVKGAERYLSALDPPSLMTAGTDNRGQK